MVRDRGRIAASLVLAALAAGPGGCRRDTAPGPPGTGTAQAQRPSILLVTLDTTRADVVGPEAAGIQTPAFNAIAARGRRFAHPLPPPYNELA